MPIVLLLVILSEAKNLTRSVILNGMKDLISSFATLRTALWLLRMTVGGSGIAQ